nr:MAG TPA: Putative transcription factor, TRANSCRIPTION.7A [Caudoviricetes sp.]
MIRITFRPQHSSISDYATIKYSTVIVISYHHLFNIKSLLDHTAKVWNH